jgi:hypothetical protein
MLKSEFFRSMNSDLFICLQDSAITEKIIKSFYSAKYYSVETFFSSSNIYCNWNKICNFWS